MAAPNAMNTQARTNTAARLKVQIVGAMAACLKRTLEAYQEDKEEKSAEGETPKRPNPLALFEQEVGTILEQGLKAPAGSVNKALREEAVLQALQQVLGRQERMMQELALHRETQGMILEHQIKGSIEQTEIRQAAAKTLGVELSRIVVPT